MNIEELKNQVFIGVVVDNNDPKKQGRCRCRVLNVFNDIAVEDIPWAKPWKDLNGNQFIVPELNKIVSVVFDSGNPYKPEYIYADHYNQNLQAKLDKLNVTDYKSMKAIMFDNKTQIYVNDTEGLMVDYLMHNINFKSGGIDINLKDDTGRLTLGDSKSDESVILGTTFIEWFDTFLDALTGTGAGPFLGNLGTPVVMNPYFANIIFQFKQLREGQKILSTNVFVPKNFSIKTVTNNQQNRVNLTVIGDDLKTTNKQIEIETRELATNNPPQEVGRPVEDLSGEPRGATYSPPPENKNNEKQSDPVYSDNQQTTVISDFSKKMLDIALKEWQIHNEQGIEDLNQQGIGRNIGSKINKYIQYATDKIQPTQWCSCFVSWCWGQVPNQYPGTKYSFQLPKIQKCIFWENWAKTNSNYVEIYKYNDGSYKNLKELLPGDVVVFAFSHIGIVTKKKVNDGQGTYETVEGNTYKQGAKESPNDPNARDGDGIFKRKRRNTWGAFEGPGGPDKIVFLIRVKYNSDKVKKVN